jgi:C-terminal processing protease CtpA/Prc
MYKKIIFLLFLLASQLIFSKNPTETQKIATTCKVWGFLKYYHPKVANGEFNWDKQLFEVLPKIEQAKTNQEFSLILENWIENLGEIKEISPIVISKDVEYFDKNFDLSWFNNNIFSKKLAKKLKFIEENRFQGKQHYISDGINEMFFIKNENYSEYKFSDKNSRFLALFAYWNVIEYFFPYKYLIDIKWDKTLEEMLPNFINAQNEEDFFDAMQQLTVRLNDTHVKFFVYKDKNQSKTYNYFPADCKIIDEKMVVTNIFADSLAKADGIKIGDVITKINDKSIKEIIAENRKIIGGSNEVSYLNNLIDPVLRSYEDNFKIDFLKDGKTVSRTIKIYDYHDSHRNQFLKGYPKKEKFKMLDNNIGYVNMGRIMVANIPDMIEKLSSAKAIVFDIRNYPNSTYEEISKFLNPKKALFAIYTEPDPNYPGRFQWKEGTSSGTENPNYYKGKVIVLLNEKSISQSEWTAMCFQTAPNTTIIGSQTAGADGNVFDISFIKQFFTRMSGLGVYYPDRRETQRIGIIPDIEVKPTILGIQQGKDEVLDRAIQFIETGK